MLRGLPDLHEIVRGSLLKRVTRHRLGCPKCAAGDGHDRGLPRRSTRQLSLRAGQVPLVRTALASYQKLKATLEAVCELDQRLFRQDSPDPAPPRGAARA